MRYFRSKTDIMIEKEGGRPMNDEKIIDLFFQRNENAIQKLDEQYGSICKKIAFHILRNQSDAEECANDTFLAVWNAIPPQNPDSLPAFVYRITRNIATERYRKNTAQKRNGFYDVTLEELEECLPSDDSFFDLEAKTLSLLFDEFLATLKEEERAIFLKRFWYSESVAEIAEEIGATAHYVSVKLSRTKNKLKNFLQKKGFYL